MFPLLYSYLIEYRSLYLPGLGRLQMVRKPAEYDVANQQLQPPHTMVELAPAEDTSIAQGLISFVASKLNIAAESAGLLCDSFCKKILDDINEQGHFTWPQFGVFEREISGNIVFKADDALASVNKPVPAARVVRQGKMHAMVVGDNETTSTQMQEYFAGQDEVKPASRWWIPALVIGVVAVVLILLKKMQVL